MKLYCPDCGQVNEYSGVKPNFCGFCQASLSLSGNLPSETIANQRNNFRRAPIGRRPIIRDEEEDMQTDGTLPDIRKLEVEIEVPELHRETVGEIWGSGAIGGRLRPAGKSKAKKVNKKNVLDNFRDSIFKKTVIDLNPNE